MADDSSIPSFLSLRNPGTRRGRTRSTPARTQLAASASVQLAFHLVPPEAVVPQPEPTPTPAPTPREPILYTVRQLIAELRGHLESAYTGILNVEGEISNCRPAGSGHLYFTLKDGDAQLPVVMFRRQAQLLAFKLRDGLAVEVRGRITVYESRGQLQLIAETLRPRGTGALQLAFEQLRDRLRREGLFDRPRTPLPPFPHCIGIVTSPSGAALRDIIQVIRRRHARLNLLIFPAIMQGTQCPSTVAAGIRFFNHIGAAQARVPQVSPLRPGIGPPPPRPESQVPYVDLILIARGGGSLEDLAGFNDEALARTIAASRLPVVSAIGHEIDHTIADFVADLRAPTPSAAAELITSAQHRIEERVLSLERRVLRAGEYHLLRCRQRLQRLSASHVLARVRDSIGLREQRIDDLHRRLEAATDARLRTRHKRLDTLEARLHRHAPTVRVAAANRRLTAAIQRMDRLAEKLIASRRQRLDRTTVRLSALSPLAVLNRGYAIVYAEDGMVLRSSAEVSPGADIRARLAEGTVRARVLGSNEFGQ